MREPQQEELDAILEFILEEIQWQNKETITQKLSEAYKSAHDNIEINNKSYPVFISVLWPSGELEGFVRVDEKNFISLNILD